MRCFFFSASPSAEQWKDKRAASQTTSLVLEFLFRPEFWFFEEYSLNCSGRTTFCPGSLTFPIQQNHFMKMILYLGLDKRVYKVLTKFVFNFCHFFMIITTGLERKLGNIWKMNSKLFPWVHFCRIFMNILIFNTFNMFYSRLVYNFLLSEVLGSMIDEWYTT